MQAGERTLITTLTKRLAEDLSEYIRGEGYKCKYLHSEVDTLERMEILKQFRLGTFDVLVGVNLLREGLDLPEVSLVAILDADKEGFLRSRTSLVQTIGRCARNVNARVLLYADRITESMRQAMAETSRRRQAQLAYNAEHGITPRTIRKAIRDTLLQEVTARRTAREVIGVTEAEYEIGELIAALEAEMLQAAEELDFERAAELRDEIAELKKRQARGEVAAKRGGGSTGVPPVAAERGMDAPSMRGTDVSSVRDAGGTPAPGATAASFAAVPPRPESAGDGDDDAVPGSLDLGQSDADRLAGLIDDEPEEDELEGQPKDLPSIIARSGRIKKVAGKGGGAKRGVSRLGSPGKGRTVRNQADPTLPRGVRLSPKARRKKG